MPTPVTQKLTLKRLKEVLEYEPLTGVFTWKKSLSKNVPVGAVAGRQSNGYTYIGIDGTSYLAQRLAWLYVKGQWPSWTLRFKNDNRSDIRIENLYEYHSISKRCTRDDPFSKSKYEKAWRQAFPEKVKDSHLRKSFGMTLEEYMAKHAAQNGKCAICRRPETSTRNGKTKSLAVDHCHKSGKIRDLLCAACNKAIGLLKEDVGVLTAAIAYLRHHASEDKPNFDGLRVVGGEH